jgi:hypothetical protein
MVIPLPVNDEWVDVQPQEDDGWVDVPDEPTWGQAGRQFLANAPGVIGGMAQSLVDPGMSVNMGRELATNPEARGALVDHYKNYGSEAGWKKNIADASIISDAAAFTPLKGARKLPQAAAAPLKTIKQLKEGGGAALNVARDSGVYFTSEFVHPLRNTLTTIAHDGGFRPGREGTSGLSKIMKDVDSMSDRPWGFRDIRELEQDLNDAWVKAKRGTNPSDTLAGIAGRQRAAVRQFMQQVEGGATEGLYATGDLTPAQAAKVHQEGLKIYSTAKRAQGADQLRNLAENDKSQFIQSGVANSIRKRARQILARHHKGQHTGFDARDIETLENLRDGRVADWVLMKARRYAGPVGTAIGAGVGESIGVGAPLGAAATWALGEGVSKAADTLAMRRLNRFVETIQADGTERLQALLGETAHNHLYGTPRGKAAAKNWIKSIGTKGINAATRSLAAVIAQEAKRTDLIPRIEAEITKLVEDLERTAQADEEPQ